MKGDNFTKLPYLDVALTDPEIKRNAEEPGTGILNYTNTHRQTGISNTVNDSAGTLSFVNTICLSKIIALWFKHHLICASAVPVV